jgi:hypothetical protein
MHKKTADEEADKVYRYNPDIIQIELGLKSNKDNT